MGVIMILDKDYWATPQDVVKGISSYCYAKGLVSLPKPTIDVCATPFNTKVQDNYITEEENALVADWGKFGLAWCNPPYSRGNVGLFFNRALEQYRKNQTETIMLLNCDNGTAWFADIIANAKAVIYVMNGRIKFLDPETGAESKNPPKPNMVVVVGERSNDHIETHYLSLDEIFKLGA